MQMVEDTLIEHAHTKPLLPSQLIRYREVQVPDGRSPSSPVPLPSTQTHPSYALLMPVSTATTLKGPHPALLSSSSLMPSYVGNGLIRFNIRHFPQRNRIVTRWKMDVTGRKNKRTHCPLSPQRLNDEHRHAKQSTCAASLITLGKSSDVERKTRAARGPPGDFLCFTEGFSRLGSRPVSDTEQELERTT